MTRANHLTTVPALLSAWLAVAAFLSFAGGCSNGSGKTGPVDAGHDAGVTVTDGGTDAGPPTDAGPVDAGPTGACAAPYMSLPTTLLPRCQDSTKDCLNGCATATDPATCVSDCTNADSTPPGMIGSTAIDCSLCILSQQLHCWDTNGCHTAVADYFCCIASQCPAGSSSTCASDKCGQWVTALSQCASSNAAQCAAYDQPDVAMCFGAVATDGGVPDAGVEGGAPTEGGAASDAGAP